MMSCGRRFNEAEAIKPRNRVDLRWLCREGDAASMRPRQSSLGIVLYAPQLDHRHFGRFNEAEAIKPRNLRTEQLDHSAGLVTASMRPRQSSLGI